MFVCPVAGIDDVVIDRSGNALNGLGLQRPIRAMTGYNWTGRHDDWRVAPQEYGGIAFHDDAVVDCEWESSFSVVLPKGIKSGISSVSPQISVESTKRVGAFALIALVLVGLYVTKDNIIELIRPTPEPPKLEAVQEQVVEEVKPETAVAPSTLPAQPSQAPVTPEKK